MFIAIDNVVVLFDPLRGQMCIVITIHRIIRPPWGHISCCLLLSINVGCRWHRNLCCPQSRRDCMFIKTIFLMLSFDPFGVVFIICMIFYKYGMPLASSCLVVIPTGLHVYSMIFYKYGMPLASFFCLRFHSGGMVCL